MIISHLGGLQSEVPYRDLDDLAKDLMLEFQDNRVNPAKAYLSCLLVAGHIGSPTTVEWDSEQGTQFLNDINDWIRTYWPQGLPS